MSIDTITIRIHRITKNNERAYRHFLRKAFNKKEGFFVNSSSGVLEAADLITTGFRRYEKTGQETLQIYGKIYVPSWNYNIHFSVKDEFIQLEFSLPKLIYGTNALQLLSHQAHRRMTVYDYFIDGMEHFYKNYLNGLPIDNGAVEIRRFDFCFNQVFHDKAKAKAALRIFKKRSKKSEGKLDYKNGIVELNKSSYFKIYHKGAEFEVHDLPKILKLKGISDRDKSLYRLLPKIQELSDCTLRYERKYTPSAIAREFNLRVTFNGDKDIRKEYNTITNKERHSKADKLLKSSVEEAPILTIGHSLIDGGHKMPAFFFEYLYSKFRDDIKNRWTINRKNPLTLDDLSEKEAEKNRRLMKNIHMYIDKYGSIKQAYDNGAIAERTFYKYKKFLKQRDINSEVKRFVIEQDFTNTKYHRKVRNLGISPVHLCSNTKF